MVYGNMASGKSSFIEQILPLLPDYTYVNLDDIRIELSKKFTGTTLERRCEEECQNRILSAHLVVYETNCSYITL
jgi:predicted kinase